VNHFNARPRVHIKSGASVSTMSLRSSACNDGVPIDVASETNAYIYARTCLIRILQNSNGTHKVGRQTCGALGLEQDCAAVDVQFKACGKAQILFACKRKRARPRRRERASLQAIGPLQQRIKAGLGRRSWQGVGGGVGLAVWPSGT
jgi:hypothetical protein